MNAPRFKHDPAAIRPSHWPGLESALRDALAPEPEERIDGVMGVIPVTVEEMPSEGYRFLLLVREFDFSGVEAGVEFATDGQSCGVVLAMRLTII